MKSSLFSNYFSENAKKGDICIKEIWVSLTINFETGYIPSFKKLTIV